MTTFAAPAPAGAPASLGVADVSVIICAYTDRRWDALVGAVASVRRQTPQPLQTIVVVDHNADLLAKARDTFTSATVIANTGCRGLSGARNSGVAAARGEFVAFLDDDARAETGWLSSLLAPFEDPGVIGAGGVAVPQWQSTAPAWIPAEFLWVVGCSYRGLPEKRATIRNPIGANMAFRREVLVRAGGFVEGIGRVGRIPLGCEETELSIRARELTGGAVVHVPECAVRHLVTDDRTTWRYYRTRCWSEGLSKALVRRSVGGDAALGSERGYVARTLPAGVWRGIKRALGGELAGLEQAAAIVAGLTITIAGYAWGCMRKAR